MPMATATILALAALATTAAGTGAELHQANEATQHAKGAAEAQAKTMQEQIDLANKTDAASASQKMQTGSATQAAALAALKASMSASSSTGGTVLGGSSATPAPLTQKTLLGA